MLALKKDTIWLAVIIAATILVYSPSLTYNFYPKLDDGKLITENPIVTHFPENASAIFTEFVYGLYHPLTTISFIIDYQFFKDNPLGFRLHNLLLHLLNTLLVFLLIKQLTKNTFITLFSALIFALHPMHMESVIWISERKDVLFTFYFLLSAILYLKYRENKHLNNLKPSNGGNKTVPQLSNSSKKHGISIHVMGLQFALFLTFLLSMMAKATAVILPVILILFDYLYDEKFTRKQFTQKWYLFILSLVFGFINIKAQNSIAFIQPIAHKYTLIQLFTIPVHAITWYVTQFFVPLKLATKHLYPRVLNGHIAAHYYLAWVWLVAIIYSLYRFKKNKWFVTGILFYLVAIALFIKVIPTGNDVVSERYTYVPYIGLSMALGAVLQQFVKYKMTPVYFTILIIFYGLYDVVHSKNWKNEKAIWSRVIVLQPEMSLAYYERGNSFFYEGDYPRAFADFKAAVQHAPDFYEAYIKKGLSAYFIKNQSVAKQSFTAAIALQPNNPEAYYHRGNLRLANQEYKNALSDFKKSVRFNYTDPEVLLYLAKTYENLQQFDAAITTLNQYLQANSKNSDAYTALARCYLKNNQYRDAIKIYQHLQKTNPNDIRNLYFLANAYAKTENFDEAIKLYTRVIQTKPMLAGAYINRGNAYLFLGNQNMACQDWQKALELGANQVKSMIEKYCPNH